MLAEEPCVGNVEASYPLTPTQHGMLFNHVREGAHTGALPGRLVRGSR